jgi:hypothetical protein
LTNDLQKDATGEGKGNVAKKSGNTLELRVKVVEYASAEGRAVFRDGLVTSY